MANTALIPNVPVPSLVIHSVPYLPKGTGTVPMFVGHIRDSCTIIIGQTRERKFRDSVSLNGALHM